MHKKIAILCSVLIALSPALALADSNVVASSDAGSTISPSGLVSIPTGVMQTFSIGAQNGFFVAGVSFDGASLGPVSSVGFTGIAADPTLHTLSVDSIVNVARGGGSMVVCSGPMAPGYQVGIPGGGCGGTSMWVPYNGTSCLFNNGCVLPGN